MLQRTFVVTGANRGIGFAICQALLAQQPDAHVVVAARNLSDAEAAVKELGHPGRTSAQAVELVDEQSIRAFAKSVPEHDVLINNAGHAEHGDAFDEKVARDTVGPNFFGTRSLTYALLEAGKIRANGRIVNVTSVAGTFEVYTDALIARLRNATDEDLDKLAHEFYAGVADGSYDKRGFPRSTYRVSKALENAWSTRVLPHDPRVRERHLFVGAIHPGFVQTRMSSFRGDRTAEQGAVGPVWLATAPLQELRDGQYYKNKGEVQDL
jgi:carbonyl reductase 1